jgi:putative flippase GtrA
MAQTQSDILKSRYIRAQLVALSATGIDFALTLFTKEILGMYYVVAAGIGALCGACTAFLLNRTWVFDAGNGRARSQVLRYLVALAGSAVLNTSGTYLVTEQFHSHYVVSKILVALLIGTTYSYFILKFFVFPADANK